MMQADFLPEITDRALHGPLRGTDWRAFVDCLRADMSKGMNPWANEMKPIVSALGIDFFKFVGEVQKVLMAIKKFGVGYMILLHEAQTSSKVTKIRPVGFWKDSIECR
jgi:hypothetical protein